MGIRVRVSRSLAQHTGGVAVDPQDGIWKVEEHETREDRILCCVYAHDLPNEAHFFRHALRLGNQATSKKRPENTHSNYLKTPPPSPHTHTRRAALTCPESHRRAYLRGIAWWASRLVWQRPAAAVREASSRWPLSTPRRTRPRGCLPCARRLPAPHEGNPREGRWGGGGRTGGAKAGAESVLQKSAQNRGQKGRCRAGGGGAHRTARCAPSRPSRQRRRPPQPPPPAAVPCSACARRNRRGSRRPWRPSCRLRPGRRRGVASRGP